MTPRLFFGLIAGVLGLTTSLAVDATTVANPQPPATVITRYGPYQPPLPRSPFSALPRSIRRADSGLTLSGGVTHQSYDETGSVGTLDAERGRLTRLGLGWSRQWRHWGLGVALGYATGSTRYYGQLQNGTPITDSTRNKFLDARVYLVYGFSPWPRLAVVPGVYAAQHTWLRGLGGPQPYTERYQHRDVGVTTSLQYAIPRLPVVLSLGGRLGEMISADMNGLSHHFNLGGKMTYGLMFEADWNINARFGVCFKEAYSGFGYGKSNTVDVGGGMVADEPNSTTHRNTLGLGLRVRFGGV